MESLASAPNVYLNELLKKLCPSLNFEKKEAMMDLIISHLLF